MGNDLGRYREGNFTATLREGGQVVDCREGHNVVTDYGSAAWLPKLVAWDSFGVTPHDNSRVRWVGLGTGWAPETPDVQFLVAPAHVDPGLPVLYLGELSAPTRPVTTALRYDHVFAGALVASAGTVNVTEFGLYAGYLDTGVYYPEWESGTFMDPESSVNPVVAYKSFDTPFVVTAGSTLTIEWEIRF